MNERNGVFVRFIRKNAQRKASARKAGPQAAWSGLGMIGVIGWSVVLPTLLGALLGGFIERHSTSRHPWTLTLLVSGLLLGCVNAGLWISRQQAVIATAPDDSGDA